MEKSIYPMSKSIPINTLDLVKFFYHFTENLMYGTWGLNQIQVENQMDIVNSENRFRLNVSEHRKKCASVMCPEGIFGLGFGHSPFHTIALTRSLEKCR